MKYLKSVLIAAGLFIGFSLQAQISNPVSWSYKVSELNKGIYEIRFNAKITPPWHVYALKLDKEGPIPTSFTFQDDPGYKLDGEIKEDSRPVIKYDQGFGFNIGTYHEKAEFSQKIQVLSQKEVNVKVSVEYQCCNDESCLPPSVMNLL